MELHTAIRKSVKGGGAALVVVLVVVWIGSGWWSVGSPSAGQHLFGLGFGALRWTTYAPTVQVVRYDWFVYRPTPGPFI